MKWRIIFVVMLLVCISSIVFAEAISLEETVFLELSADETAKPSPQEFLNKWFITCDFEDIKIGDRFAFEVVFIKSSEDEARIGFNFVKLKGEE